MKRTTENRNGEPLKCLWMTAGVVLYRLCDREYDCEGCDFDRAIHSHEKPGVRSKVVVRDAKVETQETAGYQVVSSLFYHPAHVWVRVEDSGKVRIGLDDFGQKLIGQPKSIRFPEPGSEVTSQNGWSVDHNFGSSTLTAAVEGTVREVNRSLLKNPELVKTDPYGEGWAMVIEPKSLLDSLKNLYYGQRVQQWYNADIDELRRSIDESSSSVGPTLQDGGTPVLDLGSLNEPAKAGQIIQKFLSVARVAKAGNGRR